MREKIRKREIDLKRLSWALAVVWSIVVAASLAWNVARTKQEAMEAGRGQARISIEKDVIYRHWNAKYGGVYVPVSKDTQPNPYLSHVPERDIETPSGKLLTLMNPVYMLERDIRTPSGRSLTLMNPAYMTRKVHELGKKEYDILGHITSLKPIRAENVPDSWEAKALQAFESGLTEVSSREDMEGKEYMRLMRPLITEKSCLKCHARQGYKLGDIRGGISVSIPMEPLWSTARIHILGLSLGHILIWFMGLGGIVFGTYRLRRSEREQRQTAETLRESETRYKELFNNMNNGVAVYEAEENGDDFVFKDFNRAGERIDKIKKEKLLGKSVVDMFPGVKDIGLFKVFQKVWKTGEPEHHPICKYQDERILGWRENYVYKLPSGEIVAVYSDETSRKQAEQKLRDSAHLNELFLDSLLHPALLVRRDRIVLAANRIAREVGTKVGEYCWRSFGRCEYIPDEHKRYIDEHNGNAPPGGTKCVFCQADEMLATNESINNPEVKAFGQLWDTWWVPVDGNVYLHYAINITERKRAEEELREAKKAAETADRAKSDFLASMSHELRTPLNAIIGFTEMLNNQYFGELNKKQEEYIIDILESGQHLLSLINDILDLSKVEAGKMELNLAQVNIKGLLKNSLIMIKEKAMKHGISIDLQIPNEMSNFEILADERKLKQVVFNLLSNAAKFTHDGGAIVVEVKQEEEGLIISISDTGIGISSKDQQKIFEEFYQVRGSTTDKTPGTGLGLPLSKSLVEMHGGKIWVESKGEGQGSRFCFILPLSIEPQDKSISVIPKRQV